MSRDTKPLYSKSQVNRAGKNVREGSYSEEDINIIENWRASHNHILNSWQSTLRNRIKSKKVFFAQRLKRRITIFDKVQREPSMALANMHDIAGCRLIFQNIKDLQQYRTTLHDTKRFKHKLYKANEDPYNYIKNPAKSGYRGVHDVYIYKAQHTGGEPWDGLKVEIQFRTIHQHAWATAVEIAGALTGDYSKFDKGSEDQKEFFRLASEIISRAYEDKKSCYPKMSNKELVLNFKKIEKKIHLLTRLSALTKISVSFPVFKKKALILSADYTDIDNPKVNITPFSSLPEATSKYFELEKSSSDKQDIVLVKAKDQDNIRNAYKNYFSDTEDFVAFVRKGISILSKRK
ncbi:MAG: RelA/SpoT domain-containing protein [Pseudomonadota bacterium]